MLNSEIILEIENIPVSDIAALRRMTVLDLSSNNIKFIPVRLASYFAVQIIYTMSLLSRNLLFESIHTIL